MTDLHAKTCQTPMCPICFPRSPVEPVIPAPHRELLFQLIERGLHAEAGVRHRRAERRSSEYHAGRRAAFISSAARLMAVLYGGDYEVAKSTVAQGVRLAGDSVPLQDLLERDTARALAKTIAESALRAF